MKTFLFHLSLLIKKRILLQAYMNHLLFNLSKLRNQDQKIKIYH